MLGKKKNEISGENATENKSVEQKTSKVLFKGVKNHRWRDQTTLSGIYYGMRQVKNNENQDVNQIAVLNESDEYLYLAIAPTILTNQIMSQSIGKGGHITIEYLGWNEEKEYAEYSVFGESEKIINAFE